MAGQAASSGSGEATVPGALKPSDGDKTESRAAALPCLLPLATILPHNWHHMVLDVLTSHREKRWKLQSGIIHEVCYLHSGHAVYWVMCPCMYTYTQLQSLSLHGYFFIVYTLSIDQCTLTVIDIHTCTYESVIGLGVKSYLVFFSFIGYLPTSCMNTQLHLLSGEQLLPLSPPTEPAYIPNVAWPARELVICTRHHMLCARCVIHEHSVFETSMRTLLYSCFPTHCYSTPAQGLKTNLISSKQSKMKWNKSCFGAPLHK